MGGRHRGTCHIRRRPVHGGDFLFGVLRLHPQIGQCLGQNLLRHRGGKLAAVADGGLGLVDKDEDCQTGLIGGGEASKGRHHILACALPRRLVGLDGGTGLAGHVIAGDVRIFGADFHDPLHHGSHPFGGILRDDRTAHGRLDLFDDVPILVQDLPDDIGLHQPPAVRHTGEAGDHLDGCDLEGLPNGGGRHVHRTDAFLHMVEGGGDPRLSQHIDAGRLGKTERGMVLAE